MNQQAVEITAKFYEMQKTAKFLAGDKYAARVEEYKVLVKRVMVAQNCDTLDAFLKIGETLPAGESCALLWFGAAVVELLESKA